MSVEVFEMLSALAKRSESSPDHPGIHKPLRRGDRFKSLDATAPVFELAVESLDEVVIAGTSPALFSHGFVAEQILPSLPDRFQYLPIQIVRIESRHDHFEYELSVLFAMRREEVLDLPEEGQ